MDFELKDRVAIVTGGGQGLGRAYCLGFAEQGARVAVVDVNAEKAAAVAEEVEATGARALAVTADISDEGAVESMVSRVERELGTPTALINNAGLLSALGLSSSRDLPVEEWDRVLAVNLKGSWLCARAVSRPMAEASYGKIVNVSSSTVWWGREGYPHYVSSKAAILGLTRALASEFGRSGICVNVVAPGLTVTEVPRETISEGLAEKVAEVTALRRGEKPEDMVGPVLFLCSPASDFVTGQTLIVDGGDAFN